MTLRLEQTRVRLALVKPPHKILLAASGSASIEFRAAKPYSEHKHWRNAYSYQPLQMRPRWPKGPFTAETRVECMRFCPAIRTTMSQVGRILVLRV
jgi:hypothetical protein